MATLLRVITDELYQNLLERGLLFPNNNLTTTEKPSKELSNDTVQLSEENVEVLTENAKTLMCRKYESWKKFDSVFKGFKK
jgi:hypothetical protein